MLISGVQKFTVLDFPNKVGCIVFTPYCNFRCGYCYNSDFVLPEKIEKIKYDFIPEDVFFNFLKSRGNFLDGVVITGGEPTLQDDLIEFIKKIKNLNLLVKLDTNGTNPDILKKLVDEKLLDYIAMDIKAPFDEYKKVIDVDFDVEKIKESCDFIKKCGVDYEFRTTVAREQLSIEDLIKIGSQLRGVKRYYLQMFKNKIETLNPIFNKYSSYYEHELKEICLRLKDEFNINICDYR